MHDPVDIRQRMERLIKRVERRDDYGQLLARGDVVRRIEDVEDVEAWRTGIKRQARADRINVRTGANEHIAYAYVAGDLKGERRAEEDRYSELMRRAVPLAVGNRHEPAVLLRDGDEVMCKCDRCSALGYANAADDVIGGALFEDNCPDDRDPRGTALGFMFGGRAQEA